MVVAEWQCGCHLLLSLLSVPLGHSSPLIKESGKTGLEDVGTGGERDRGARRGPRGGSRASASSARPG